MKTAEQIQQEFNVFKELVARTTWEWDQGCEEGKIEFLEALQLEIPECAFDYVISFSLNISGGQEGADDLAPEIERAIAEAIEDRGYNLLKQNYRNAVSVDEINPQ